MRACSGVLGNPTPCTSLPLLWLFCFSESCTTPKVASLSVVEHHRLSGIITGHFEVVIDHPLSSRPSILGRAAVYMAGRPKLPAETCLTAAEGRQGMAMYFKQMYAPTYPLSCLWLKGTRFSIFEPSIVHFNAWWPKKPSMHFEFKWNVMQISEQRGFQPLSWLDLEVKDACKCDAT